MKKIIISLAVFSLVVFGFSSHLYAEDDIIPPTVISSFPEDGSTGVAVDIKPTLTFSEPLDTSTVNSNNIELRTYTEKASDSVTISTALTYNEGNIVTFILNSNLDYNKQYYFFVGSGVKDVAGNEIIDTWYHADRAKHEFTAIAEIIPPADTVSPVITLTGENTININVGDSYTDAGATASDNIDGDITSKIIPTGTVNTTKAGTYTITYDVSDLAGNKATTITRTINVNEVSGGGGGNSDVFFGGNIVLSDNCEIEDTSGIKHNFPQEDSPSKYLGICALSQAKEQGIINDVKLDYYSGPDGLFVNSINGISKENTYWALYLNDVYEMSRGLSILPLSAGDKVSFILTTYSGEIVLPKNSVEINITSLQQPEEQKISGGGGSSHILNNKFDVDKALAYLTSKQNSDGSFISPMYTDWVSLAFASINTNLEVKEKIINYFKTTPFVSDIITDNERHAMALMSVGINPYSGTSINYIKKIIDSFDGIQFGDSSLVNDDIFAIFPLSKAGYGASDEIIQKDIFYIISKQSLNGSWDSVDMTGAAIQAIKNYTNISGVPESISKAENYLKSAQQADGGFGNSSSTSWSLQALSSLNPKASEYLAGKQQADGGLELTTDSLENRIWATSYAVPAILGKSWNDIIQEFTKPAEEKKNIEVPKIKNIKKIVSVLPPAKGEMPKAKGVISSANNLSASVNNAVPVKISLKKVSQAISHTVLDTLIYIGKGFYNLIIFLQNLI